MKQLLIPVFLVLSIIIVGCKKKEQNTTADTPAVATEMTQHTQAPAPEAVKPPVTQKISGKVISVNPADTLTVMSGKRKFIVKLYGVTLPKGNSKIITKANKYATTMVLKKAVVIEKMGNTKRGQILGSVSLSAGGRNLNHELIREGLAMWNHSAVNDDYARILEDQAKSSKKGLWAAKSATKGKKKKA